VAETNYFNGGLHRLDNHR